MAGASRAERPWVVAAALLLLCAVLYLPPVLATPFFTKGEPREGLVVRHMVEEGDWVLPKRDSGNGWAIASKPPFFHWLGALASLVTGRTSEVAVRAPSVLLGTAAILVIWGVGRTILPPAAALAGAVVVATTFEWIRAVSSARVDGTLAALMTAGLMLLYRGYVQGGLSRTEALATYSFLAAATLTKGPVGFILPGVVLAMALLVQGKILLLRRFHPILGAAVILGLAGAWYLAAWQIGGDAFVQKQVLKENVFRFLGASRLRSGHEHPFYYYLPTFAAGFLPWTPFLLAALAGAVRSSAARRDPRTVFLLVWIGAVLLFYSVASAKRSVYLLALYPAAGLLVGWWWEGLKQTGPPRWLRGRTARCAVGLAAGAVLLPLAVTFAEGVGLAPLALLAPFLHPKDQANLPIVRGIIDAHFPAVLVGLGLALAALVATLNALRRERWALLFTSTTALATVCWLLVFGVFQPELGRRRTFAPFFADIEAQTAGPPLQFYPGTFDFGAAFYAPRGTRHWRADRQAAPGPHYVLVWDEGLAQLAADHPTGFDILATSEGTEPKGRRHLCLVRLR
jgi:4-amino-4-deoxy-L-arabinose transferase-like glycosyltransferase